MKRIFIFTLVLISISALFSACKKDESIENEGICSDSTSSEISESSSLVNSSVSSDSSSKAEDSVSYISSSSMAEISSSSAGESASSDVVSSKSESTSSPVISESKITYIDNLEEEILKLVNNERAANGLPAYELHQKLTETAKLRTTEIIVNDYFYHQRPSGQSFVSAFGETSAPFMSFGENIAQIKGDKSVFDSQINNAEYWFTLWKNSPTHYENILYKHYSHIGISVGYVVENGKYRAIATQSFGGAIKE